MADSIVKIQSSTSGDTNIDNSAVTVAGSSVRRERIVIGDDTAATGLAPVTSSGGMLVTLAAGTISILTSLTSATVYQGTTPWSTLAATSGGAQPVAQSSTPWSVVASSTGGSQPVSVQNALLAITASSTGGAQPVSILVGSTSSLQLVQHTTSGGAQPVAITVGSTSSLQLVQAATSGGAQPVSASQSSTPWLVVASSTGGAQPVVQSSTPWGVVASTTGGNAPVFLGNTLPLAVTASTTGGNVPVTATQNTTPWTVVSSTTGGAIAISTQVSLTSLTSGTVYQGVTPWTVVASTTGGNAPVTIQNAPSVIETAIARASMPGAIADGTVSNVSIDTKGRLVVTPIQIRQLTRSAYLQVVATGETILLAGASGTYHDLLYLVISSATSNIVGASCVIKDSSGGATQFRLNIQAGGSGGGAAPAVLGPFAPGWKHTTATSTGSAWTLNFSIAGTYDVSALFADWTS